jgi:hypothetical protein
MPFRSAITLQSHASSCSGFQCFCSPEPNPKNKGITSLGVFWSEAPSKSSSCKLNSAGKALSTHLALKLRESFLLDKWGTIWLQPANLKQEILILDSEAFLTVFDVRNCLVFKTDLWIERLLLAQRYACGNGPHEADTNYSVDKSTSALLL